ncbi:MAG TPA: fumarylacetoacetate hydrolase family protein [Streptosporangiaceae bacterium]|nr:fumarylacetoacetate hydrolase family protein [Streptosporangiaceae bacterium]
MHIIKYWSGGSRTARVGVLIGDRVHELKDVGVLAALWALRLDDLKELLCSLDGDGELARSDVMMLPPIDGRTEVWACGVTYKISREARIEESEQSADVYRQVYDATRPELFYKSAAWRVVGDGEAIAIRSDSTLDVPEPEVALVVNAFGETVGYTICNDVSSRSIEGENPLYLPQAKVYLGGCALGPSIRPAWEVDDPYALAIGLNITRGGQVVWSGTASTSQLHRTYYELVSCLLHSDVHPDGVILSTGTCLVPPAPFSLQQGDIVRIDIGDIGTLTTSVVRGLDAIKATFA